MFGESFLSPPGYNIALRDALVEAAFGGKVHGRNFGYSPYEGATFNISRLASRLTFGHRVVVPLEIRFTTAKVLSKVNSIIGRG